MVLSCISKGSLLTILEELARNNHKDDEQVQTKAVELIETFALNFKNLKDIYPEFQAAKLRYDMYMNSITKENSNVSGHALSNSTLSQKRKMEEELENITKGANTESFPNYQKENNNNKLNYDQDEIERQYKKLAEDTNEVKIMISKAEEEIQNAERFGVGITDEFLDQLDILEQVSLRLIDLVEAATLGMLRDENMLELYLDLNDKVISIIEQMKKILQEKNQISAPDLIMFSSLGSLNDGATKDFNSTQNENILLHPDSTWGGSLLDISSPPSTTSNIISLEPFLETKNENSENNDTSISLSLASLNDATTSLTNETIVVEETSNKNPDLLINTIVNMEDIAEPLVDNISALKIIDENKPQINNLDKKEEASDTLEINNSTSSLLLNEQDINKGNSSSDYEVLND